MKKSHPKKTQRQYLFVYPNTLVSTLILIVTLMPTIVLAEKPATKASCEGIAAAYPILGEQCENNSNKINHQPADASQRRQTFQARVTVMEIFRKAMLCNGMYGADERSQQPFKNQEKGHLEQLKNLHQAMINHKDPEVPEEYTVDNLRSVTIRKQQCN